jgi:hypothetical protein
VFVLEYAELFCTPLLPHITAELFAGGLRRVFGDAWFQQDAIPRKRQELQALITRDLARRPDCAVERPAEEAGGAWGGGDGGGSIDLR